MIRQIRSERFRRLSGEAVWIVAGSGLSVLGMLVGVRILTSLLVPTAYGELALGMTLSTLVNQTVLGPLGNGINRFYATAVEQHQLAGFLAATRKFVWSATRAMLGIFPFIILSLVLSGRARWIALAAATVVFALLTGYSALLSGIQNAARQRSVVALHQAMDPWLRFAIAALLMITLGASSTVAMAGYAIAMIVVLFSQYVQYRKLIKANTGDEEARDEHAWKDRIWQFAWPISVWGVFTWLQLASDKWSLQAFATTKEVGLYGLLYLVGYYPISLGSSMVVQFIAPILYARAGDATSPERNAHVGRMTWWLTVLCLGLTGVGVLGAWLFHRQVFHLLADDDYASVSYLLPWTVLAGGVFAASQAIALELQTRLRTRAMMVSKISTAVLGVACNIAGAYWYGTEGVVIACVVFSTACFASMYLLSRGLGSRPR